MSSHEYTSISDADVDRALRLVEQHETEGWVLLTILPCAKPLGVLGMRSEFGITVVMRRPASRPASA